MSFFSSRKFELTEGISHRGCQTMVRENECSSYLRFELMSDLYKEVLGNVQGTTGNSSR